MSERMTVLVLGVGGNVSQGILKALEASGLPVRVVAACVDPLAPGLFVADRAYVSPAAADPAFVDWVADVCEREGVAAVLSGVEPVLSSLAEAAGEIEARAGAMCLVSPPEVLAVGQDKLVTCRWLESQGLPCPRYAPARDEGALEALVAAAGFPLLAKPRVGKAARGVARVESPAELARFSGREDYLLQDYMGDAAGEFTCGSFCDRNGAVRGTVVMTRELVDGTTVRARAVAHPEVREVVERIVTALGPVGPCNVQLRLVDGRPVPFELNVRFSGTTPMRVRLGFNEVEAALRHFVLGEEDLPLANVEEGVVLRYWNEMYVSPEAASELQGAGELKDPGAYPRFTEPWGGT